MKKNITAIGFQAGQYGDIIMGLVPAKAFKTYYPESKLTLGIAEKYKDISPLFEQNKYFDNIHIWEGYDNWPTQNDINYMHESHFSIIFDPMEVHTKEDWYLKKHQTEELCLMHRILPPKDLQIELNQYFKIKNNKKFIAIVKGAITRGNEKSLSNEKTLEISNLISKLGYETVQLGGNNEEQILGNKYIGTFFEKIKFMLSCKILITVDTSYSWISSGYSFPTLGLYNYSYYPKAETSKNWQPINKNAVYLESNDLNNINIESIEEGLKKLL